MNRLHLARFAVLAIFLYVVYWVVCHSYLIVSTASVIAGLGVLAILLWVGVEILMLKMRRKQ